MNFADKKAVVFDLDGTIATSKQPITSKMAALLQRLLATHQVCIISGESFEQFQKQVLSQLGPDTDCSNLHIMPTCGTRYYRFQHGQWHQLYSEDLPETDRQKIVQVLTEGAQSLGYWPQQSWGPVVEDRGTQVTYSALGQSAPIEAKLAWDPHRQKRLKLRDYVLGKLNGYEVDVSGTTSIDVTKAGIDKAYGVNKLLAALGITKQDVVFLGDQLAEGGNDHPVMQLGIDTIAVHDWHETADAISQMLQ